MNEPKTIWTEMTGEADPDESDRRMLTNLLRAFCEARAEEAHHTKRKDALGKQLKIFLEAHPNEVLWDGEHKIEARLQERSGGITYDLISIYKNDPRLFDRLFETGCLMVDAAAVKVQSDQVGNVDKYAMPKRGSLALIVEEK